MEPVPVIKRSSLAIASFAIATSLSLSHADNTGYVYQDVHQVTADGDGVFGGGAFDGTVIDLWLEVDDANDILLNITDFNDVNLGIAYYQSFTGGSWLPNNLGPPFETDNLQYADSYVSIGGYNGGVQPGANGTGLDPNFGGVNADGPEANAGWYNSNPGDPIGAAVATSHTSTGLGVFIGRFAINGANDLSLAGTTLRAAVGPCGFGGCDPESFTAVVIDASGCRYDLNADGTVDAGDLGLILAAWGPCHGGCYQDLNNDGIVDGGDLGLILGFWDDCVW